VAAGLRFELAQRQFMALRLKTFFRVALPGRES